MNTLRAYQQVLRGVHEAAVWEKHASTAEGLVAKTAHARAVWQFFKEASFWSRPLGKGLMYGAGAAVPATAAGGYLIGRAGDESRKTIADARNKALQTALGVAGLGAGMYALHRATKPTAKTTTGYARDASGEMVPVKSLETKLSAAQPNPDEVLEKLATVAFLDVIFEDRLEGAAEEDQAKLAECQALNAEHGVDLLRQLLS